MREYQLVNPVRANPNAMVSNFYRDRTLRDMGFSVNGSLDEIIDNAPVDEDTRINLVDAIAIYCEPRSYPTDQYLQKMPRHLSVGIEFDPKHAKNNLRRIKDEASSED